MYEKNGDKYSILQGDIFQDFDYYRWIEEVDGRIDAEKIKIPFFVVLTQACDLEQDFKDRSKTEKEKRDKMIDSILVCPAYLAVLVKEGKHLEGAKILREKYNSDRWNSIKSNNHPRYHFLKQYIELKIPDLVIDFKQYYTLPVSILYKIWKKHYLGTIKDLYREDLSHRFAFYLSRIGLPNTLSEEDLSIKTEENFKE